MGAGSPPRRPPTTAGVLEPDDYRYETILQAIDRLSVRQLRQLTVEVNLRLEFKTRKP